MRWLPPVAAVLSGLAAAWSPSCTLQTHGELEVPGGVGLDASAGAAGHGGALFTGGAGGGAAGTNPGGNSGAAGAAGPENCVNGVDDNQDGLVDCEDPKCTPNHICVPAPPAGWSSVSFQRDRAPNTQPTSCGDLQPSGTALFKGINAPAGGCSCGCGTASGGQCTGGVTLWQYGNCGGGPAQQPNGCYDIHLNGWTIGGVETTQPYVSTAGTCSAAASGAPQPASWNKTLDLCKVTDVGAGCGAGNVCVPRPAAPFDNLACVEQSGKVDCPAGYPQQTLYWEQFNDNRICSPTGCSCGAAAGQVCDFKVELYTAWKCDNAVVGTYPLDGQCHATGFGNGYIGSTKIVGNIKGGSCEASGAPSITGAVNPTGAHSVCCNAL
jgi:hypothetical protein